MIRLAGWQKFWQARAELRDLKAKYQSMCDHYRTALLRLDEATSDTACTEREQALFARIEQMEEYASQVEHERDEARREVDEVRAGLVFLEGQFFKGEGSEA